MSDTRSLPSHLQSAQEVIEDSPQSLLGKTEWGECGLLQVVPRWQLPHADQKMEGLHNPKARQYKLPTQLDAQSILCL